MVDCGMYTAASIPLKWMYQHSGIYTAKAFLQHSRKGQYREWKMRWEGGWKTVQIFFYKMGLREILFTNIARDDSGFTA